MSHGRHGRVTTSQKAVSAGAAVASGAFAAGALAAVAVAGGQAPAPSVHTAPDPLHSQTVNAPVTADETALVVHSAKVQEARTQSHRSYHVKSGDTLSGIAQLYCGDAAKYHSLATSNGIADPNLIYVGQHLVLDCASGALIRAPRRGTPGQSYHPRAVSYSGNGGTLSYSGLESLWEAAGGPSWAASSAAAVAECESGGNQYAHNPSGASGYWQILGEVVPGNVYDPMVNAQNAVAKFRASGDSWAQWVCKP